MVACEFKHEHVLQIFLNVHTDQFALPHHQYCLGHVCVDSMFDGAPVCPVQVAFVEMPNFNFDLTLYGGDIGFLPGLEAWITTVIKDSVLRYSTSCLASALQCMAKSKRTIVSYARQNRGNIKPPNKNVTVYISRVSDALCLL